MSRDKSFACGVLLGAFGERNGVGWGQVVRAGVVEQANTFCKMQVNEQTGV